MCLAIVKPKGAQIARAYLERGYDENNHGCGFAYSMNNRLHVLKGFKDFGAFYSAIRPLMAKHPMLVHFRLATHGDKSASNMHPFLINDSTFAVIHNGCLSIKTHDNKSDTRVFCESVLEPMFRRVRFDDKALQYLVEGNIGNGNKIAVMRHDGKTVIFNEHLGHWHKGAWYSNHSYEKRSWLSAITPSAATGTTTREMWKRLGYPEPKQGQSWLTATKPSVVTEPDEDELAAEAMAQIEAEKQCFPDYEGRAFENKAGSL